MSHVTFYVPTPSCRKPVEYTRVTINVMGVSLSAIPSETKGRYYKQMMAYLNTALGPFMGVMKAAGMVSAIIDMLKAVVTLNIADMVEALEKIMQRIIDILSLIPPLVVIKLIWDMIRLFVYVIDVMIEEIQAIVDFEASLVENSYNATAIACLRENIEIMKRQKLAEVESVMALMAPLNTLLDMIGMNAVQAGQAASLDGALTTLRTIRGTLSVLLGGR